MIKKFLKLIFTYYFDNKSFILDIDDDLGIPIVREINDDQGQGESGQSRKTNREIAAQRREAFEDRYKSYQDKAKNKMKDRQPMKLKTKPLSQLKDSLK